MANDPTHQFQIITIVPIEVGGIDLSFTNSTLFMAISAGLAIIFMTASTSGRGLVPGRWQSLAEITYEFVASTLRNCAGSDGMRFFAFVFSLFIFIFLGNLLGNFPYFFTFTSHIIVTFALAMTVMTVVVIYGVKHNGLKFLNIFVPSGIPVFLLPVMPLIEFISFLSRPISLSFRLFANMLGGHIALKVFAGFVVSLGTLGTIGIVGALLPLAMTLALTALEILVAFLQAYVFIILTSIYLNDALHPGH